MTPLHVHEQDPQPGEHLRLLITDDALVPVVRLVVQEDGTAEMITRFGAGGADTKITRTRLYDVWTPGNQVTIHLHTDPQNVRTHVQVVSVERDPVHDQPLFLNCKTGPKFREEHRVPWDSFDLINGS